MKIARVFTAQPDIPKGVIIEVEADIHRGLHAFSIVGLASKAIEEAKDRVGSAIKHSGYPSPKSQNHKIVISLAPADLKKDGPLFDLPITIAYLEATEAIQSDAVKRLLVGELSLDGRLRPIRGVLSIVQAAVAAGFAEIIVPFENKAEASCCAGIAVVPAETLREVIAHINPNHPDHKKLSPQPLTPLSEEWTDTIIRLEDIKGQESAKRALVIAAAGGHNMILVGPPGTGKTMLARALPSLLPPLSRQEALEVYTLRSIAGEGGTLSTVPPFRTPHHTASHTALVGGGSHPRPGEITLAHRGVLFLDEFAEFERRSIDALRQPLEDRVIAISRVQGTVNYPADFMLVAAVNPYRGKEDGTADFARSLEETYRGKISGPILDRIDLWIEVPHVPHERLSAPSVSGETDHARSLITKARERQRMRFPDRPTLTNSRLSSRDLEAAVTIQPAVKTILQQASERLNLSPRGYHRLIKVARTIADLNDHDIIEEADVLEALHYRMPL